MVGYLIPPPFSSCLPLISPWFINNRSAVKKAVHKLFPKKCKAKQGLHIFCCLFVVFFSLESVLADEARQAGGRAGRGRQAGAGRQPPSAALPSQLDGGGCRGATLIYVS